MLSLMTGHMSPQFHCTFDDLFETLWPSAGNPRPVSNWQGKTGFTMDDDVVEEKGAPKSKSSQPEEQPS